MYNAWWKKLIGQTKIYIDIEGVNTVKAWLEFNKSTYSSLDTRIDMLLYWLKRAFLS